MSEERIEFLYHYTLSPEWQQQVADKLGAVITDQKIMVMPDSIATGSSIFLEVLPGLSVFLLDMTFHVPVAITRIATDQNYYMAYFDLGDEVTTHLLHDTEHRAGYQSKLGMGFMDASIRGIIIPPVEERSYSLRLIIDKDFLKCLFAPNREEEITSGLFDESKNTLFFYSHIDSRSKVLLNSLENLSFTSTSFELKLKSTALRLLAYLVDRATRFQPIINKLSQQDIDQVLKTSQYMLDNLLSDFPGLHQLSAMADMSVSKYKVLFKKILKQTPNRFFLNEKMLLAQTLLLSGNFNNVNDVAYELGYNQPGYFSGLYKKNYGILPGEIMVKS
ncbi:helix-turn-helix transcriptional regulator [Pedobacter hartonius]|uniref:AraC-type DNA-binding protein n=1 Tax=Pedobacter hartonius TaxID=425514 RepID=A0A1H4GM15_9SPHI|nr:helix-turn-helix transcriptional regulator [Pedobacter hartonius]SEB10645.1 AraC-type DNA-binding protein [Pedobacter hartonius]